MLRVAVRNEQVELSLVQIACLLNALNPTLKKLPVRWTRILLHFLPRPCAHENETGRQRYTMHEAPVVFFLNLVESDWYKFDNCRSNFLAHSLRIFI